MPSDSRGRSRRDLWIPKKYTAHLPKLTLNSCHNTQTFKVFFLLYMHNAFRCYGRWIWRSAGLSGFIIVSKGNITMRIFHNQETFPANLSDNGLISMLLQLKLVQSVQPYSVYEIFLYRSSYFKSGPGLPSDNLCNNSAGELNIKFASVFIVLDFVCLFCWRLSQVIVIWVIQLEGPWLCLNIELVWPFGPESNTGHQSRR